MKLLIGIFFLLVLVACSVQSEEVQTSAQDVVSNRINISVIPTAQSVEALTLPNQNTNQINLASENKMLKDRIDQIELHLACVQVQLSNASRATKGNLDHICNLEIANNDPRFGPLIKQGSTNSEMYSWVQLGGRNGAGSQSFTNAIKTICSQKFTVKSINGQDLSKQATDMCTLYLTGDIIR